MALGRRKPSKRTGKPTSKTTGKTAGKAKPAGPTRREKLKQLGVAFTMTRRNDSKMLPLILGAFVITLAVFVLLGIVLDHPVYLGIMGLIIALLVSVAVFGRRVQRSAYSQVEGQLGVAAAVIDRMRGNWRVTPMVGFNKEQDLVHRVIGNPGIILVAEGAPSRTRNLVIAEKRRLSRVIGETPIYDIAVGDAEGQVPLRELEKHLLKLPKNIKPAQVNALEARLKALPNAAMPIPKGPMPTRMPRGNR